MELVIFNVRPSGLRKYVPFTCVGTESVTSNRRAKGMRQKKTIEDILHYRLEPLLRPFVVSFFTLSSVVLKC